MTDEISRLTAQVADATAAARNAYRDSGRLIRLLTVLSSPAAPDELLIRSLRVLSEAFDADIVAVVSVFGDRFLVTTATGLAEDDPSFIHGWEMGPEAAGAVRRGHPIACRGDRGVEVPSALAGLGLRSAAYVPMSGNEMLALYRSSGEHFSGTDLDVLSSVAGRLAVATEDRERAMAIECLARSGHLLAPHLDAETLMVRAAGLIRELTMSDDGWVVTVADGLAASRAHDGSTAGEIVGKEPRPVAELRAWPAATRGEVWTATRAPLYGTVPRTALCIPVMQDGEPVVLLYASRDRPRPFSAEIIGIGTIFASHFGAALENSSLYAELRRRATQDSLTGLANRDLARQRLDQALNLSPGPYVGLLFCDLDGFKAINDRLGHEAGDALLGQVALRLQQALRSADLLARFGGDEFVAVLGEIDRLEDVTEVGHRLVAALSEPFELFDERVTVSASIGGVLGSRGVTTSGAMLRDADAAMYVAKARGPGFVEVFDDAASHRSLDRLGIRSELLQALERDEFEVLYQPIVEMDTGATVAFEALLRWNHPGRGLVSPDVFIPLAEETGEIVAIDRWVLTEACRQLGAWKRLPGRAGLHINANLSAVQLRQADAADRIVAAMDQAGVRPRDVWLEVTERGHAGEEARAAAERLRAHGAHFALDDFGSSYSNLADLKHFPAECLKIDKSFVQGVAEEGVDRSIVRAILAMAASLGLGVVAEGVERPAQRDALIALGCRLGQGYLFAPALSAAEATRRLTEPQVALVR